MPQAQQSEIGDAPQALQSEIGVDILPRVESGERVLRGHIHPGVASVLPLPDDKIPSPLPWGMA